MKLGALNTAIRNLDGAPKIAFTLFGKKWELTVQKSSVLEQLAGHFPDGRGQETGLILHDGFLTREDRADQILNGG